jgi:2,4-dienoyl-CoA reductase (NADPH2)
MGISPSLATGRRSTPEWGIDDGHAIRGGLLDPRPISKPAPREIDAAATQGEQRSEISLGKTTGWIHRTALKNTRRA